MTSHNTKALFSVLIIATIASQIILLRQNFSLKNETIILDKLKTRLAEVQLQLDEISHSKSYEGQKLSFVSEEMNNASLTASIENSDFLILFYFFANDCNPCLKSEISSWNQFYQKYRYGNKVAIIGVTEQDEALSITLMKKLFHIEFPVLYVEGLNDKLIEEGIISTPAIFFINMNTKTCIYSFFPTPKSKSANGFIRKIEALIS